MASAVLKYLCCCLPQPRHPQDDPERAPLLDPDILPQSTDEQRIERETLQRILEHATNRLLNIESLAAFLPSAAPATARPSSARSRSRSSSRPASPSSSPPPTTATTSKRRSRRPRTPSSTATTTSEAWRAPLASEDADAPLAPVRVVHLGHNWEELPALRSGPAASKGGGAERGKRPPSAHSMKTLPRRSRAPAALAGTGAGAEGAGGGAGPSPLSREAGEDDGEENGEHEEEGEDEDDSRFGTYASYRTAKSGGAGGTLKGGVRGLWGSEDAKDGDDDGMSEELSHAIASLEASIDDWSLPGGLGPFVAELGGGHAATGGGGGNAAAEGRRE
ncbi:hypothetical protein Rhopal_006499-T1 [Rhodotorula paludigena]|uniref:Uncharacterized protein n=1 Tax=Rhodotorula paludigena TaxID=86838 RepID=A0AAV5GY52_9BASI|nr:hypothetical protein Rhopal_006499-T1 [Rhodotorula paludigena]